MPTAAYAEFHWAEFVSVIIIGLPSLIYICLSNCCPFQFSANETQIIRRSICHSFVIFIFYELSTKNVVTNLFFLLQYDDEIFKINEFCIQFLSLNIFVEEKNPLYLFTADSFLQLFIVTSKCSCAQIRTLGWAFMHWNTNVQAHQGLQGAIEPWTVKMSATVNNNAGSSMPNP